MRNVLLLPFLVIRKISAFLSETFNSSYNRLQFLKNKIEFTSFPIISGRIQVINRGEFKIGKNVRFNCALTSNYVGLYKTCTISVQKGAKLLIDDHSGFSGVSIFCATAISIGKHVNCGGNVSIWDTDFHPLEIHARRVHDIAKIKSSPIVIDDDAFIGANSIILKGVKIGAGAIVGAGSVVTKDIPPYEIWAGNPIRFIKKIL